MIFQNNGELSMSQNKSPLVFISYSWSNSDRVLELAKRLMSNGVNVLFDKWDLKVGQDKYVFMEQAVNNPEVDKVLMICDKSYADKANNRSGGVGDETVIISSKIYENVKEEKFIPIIFEKDEKGDPYCPAYIKARIYIDLSTDDAEYETNYEQLIRNIHNKPLCRKPALGKRPEFIENEPIDFSPIRALIKQLQKSNDNDLKNPQFLFDKFNREFITALSALPVKENISDDEVLMLQIDEEKTLRDLFLDFLEATIEKDIPIEDMIISFFEEVYNAGYSATNGFSNQNYTHDLYCFALWELFICTTTMLLHYEQYKVLNSILTHNYFLQDKLHRDGEYHSYEHFYDDTETIESIYKPKSENPRYFSLASEILIKREKQPVITKKNLVNADIVLYQMPYTLNLNTGYVRWFAKNYIHFRGTQSIWCKLKSQKYCEKIMPLFGVETLEQLKKSIDRLKPNRNMRYPNSSKVIPIITDSISLEEIGSIT